jgi:iron complex transport system ATP-binding protein
MKLIDLQNIHFSIGEKILLNTLDFSLHSGEIVGLIGPNGAGKTSLLNVMAGLNLSFSGDYQFAGKNFKSVHKKTLAQQLAYLEQGAPVHWPLIAQRVIELGRIPHQGFSEKLSAADTAAVNKAIALTECESFLQQSVNTLSGGERLRVLLARLLASEPKIILADEPTAALDPYHQLHVMEILQAHARQGGAVVVVLHDINLAARFCDRLVVMNHGNIVANTCIEEILEQRILEDAYNIELAVFCESDKYSITPFARKNHG